MKLKKQEGKILKFIEEIEQAGLTVEECLSSWRARLTYNAHQYYKIETIENRNFKPIQNQLGSFFNKPKPTSKVDYKQWIHDNYGNISNEIALKLLKHEFRDENYFSI